MRKLLALFTLSKRQGLFFLLGLLCSIITIIAALGLMSIAGYLICGAAIAGLAGLGSQFNYFLPAAGVRFFAMLRIASRYADRVFTHDATFRFLKDLRVWFYKSLEPLMPKILLKYRSGDLLNRMVSDIDALDKIYLRLMIPFISGLVLIIVVTVFLAFFSVKISFILCIILLIGLIIAPALAYYAGKKPAISTIENFSLLRTQSLFFMEHLMDLILYNAHEVHLKKIAHTDKHLFASQRSQAKIQGFINATIILLTCFSLIAVLYLGIAQVQAKTLLPANLGLLALAIFAIFEAILVIPQACQYINETRFAIERIFEILDTKTSTEQVGDYQRPDGFELIFENIHFRYPKAIQSTFLNFSLTIKEKEKIAIVGPTGIGKSTLAYLATGLYQPTKGNLYYGQRDISKISPEALRTHICFINQSPYIFNESLRDNLLLANPKASDSELQQVLNKLNLKVPLDRSLGEFGAALSGGQIKRVGIARAILKNASVTILDEPFEGLDSNTIQMIYQVLLEIFCEKTLIIITHQTRFLPEEFKKFLM